MAKGLFITFSEEEILQIRDAAKKCLVEGKTAMSYSVDGFNVSKSFAMPVSEVLEECTFALKKLNPETYGNASPIRVGYVPRHLDK